MGLISATVDTLSTVGRQLLTGNSEAGILAVLGIVAATGIALGSIPIRGIKLGIAGVLFTGIIFGHCFWRDQPMDRLLPPIVTTAAVPKASALAGTVTSPASDAHATQATPVAAGATDATAALLTTNDASASAVANPAPVAIPTAAAIAGPKTAPDPQRAEQIKHIKDKRLELLLFLREFGLILFVYTIGMQVGPGFFASLRSHGLRWNLMATGIVAGGVLAAVAVVKLGHVDPAAAVGLLSGAVTNTPGLAAAQQALKEMNHPNQGLAGIGYAVAYPFGVLGIILSMLLIRFLFRIDPQREMLAFVASQGTAKGPANANFVVRNPGVAGKTIDSVLNLLGGSVVISRLLRDGAVHIPKGTAALQVGDTVHAVGTKADLDRFEMVVGELTTIDIRSVSKDLAVKRLIVTGKQVIGKSIGELDLDAVYGVNITRLVRAGVELVATPGMRLQFGDTIVVVGGAESLAATEKLVGNSMKTLEHPQLIPLFFGIMLGVVLGSIPFYIDGLSAPVKLGLAGGPLVMALILSRIGRIGPMNFYIPHSANMMLREFGIVLFLACVGLKAGDGFVDTLVKGDGLLWMACGAGITIVPLLVVAIISRLFTHINFVPLCGIMAGAMTDPPALAFANSSAGNESPALAYATVYPLTMLLRVVSAQVFVILLA